MSVALDLDTLDFDKGEGLVTVVAVDAVDGSVLMVAHADREALESTLASGEMHYRSRTRGPWHKGESSGNVQRVVALVADCDGDAILAVVAPSGPACHTGSVSCFDDAAAAAGVLGRLDELIERRTTMDPAPPESYVRALLSDRNLRLKKLGEEATELAVAATGDDTGEIASEAADLLFHLLVATRASGVTLHDVLAVLSERERPD
ncbi:MAG TPA: bifunctional phosphoribosyl-AMP cyclohydrolase/phosphoribosyl-ATP diphosphatase HisIE [Acidimicrobiales bacterium]|nr:bifunctional phosphoribosyl-AMP cyclohydrolase/phosphoribosyl-ATP diphosphatase HisIE [Acidimicrobiales bacterium]